MLRLRALALRSVTTAGAPRLITLRPHRALATDAAAADSGAEGRRAKKPAADPFTSTQPLTRLVHLPRTNGKFSVVKPTHTRMTVADRRYMGWAVHRFNEDGTRKWSQRTTERRTRPRGPWALNRHQLLYLRLFANNRSRPQHPRDVIKEVERDYVLKLLQNNYNKSEAVQPPVDPKTGKAVENHPPPGIAPRPGKEGSHIPRFYAGDKILITKYISLQKEKFEEIGGIVIRRRGGQGYMRGDGSSLGRLNSNFTIRNRVLGEGFEMTFPLYSPFIKKIEVLERATERRRHYFFLRNKDPATYMV